VDSQDSALDAIYRELGRFVVHLGDLELVAYAALRRLVPGNEGKRLADLEVHSRITTLIHESRLHSGLPHQADWIRLWERALSLVDERKRLVHNPFAIDVWEDAKGAVILTPFRLLQFRKLRPQQVTIGIDHIAQEADKAERCSQEAYQLYSRVFPNASLYEHVPGALGGNDSED